MGHRFLACLLLMITPALSWAETSPRTPCPPQDYDGEAQPDFDCPGPGEAALSPNLSPPPSVPMRVGYIILDENGNELYRVDWEGALVHRDRMLELGLKLRSLRMLRWADRLRLRSEYDIHLQHQREVAEARQTMIEEQRNAYQEQLAASEQRVQRSYAWWRSPAFWYAVGVVTAGVLVFLAAYGLSSAGG